jgi:hypothetical protein
MMMISSWSVVFLLVSLGVAHTWFLPSFFTNENFSNGFARFNEFNRNIEQFANSFNGANNSLILSAEDRKRLDAANSNCTTTTGPASASTEANPSADRSDLQTTTCVKDMIIGGFRYISTETNVKDMKSGFTAQSHSYRMFPLDGIKNETSPSL